MFHNERFLKPTRSEIYLNFMSSIPSSQENYLIIRQMKRTFNLSNKKVSNIVFIKKNIH